MKNSLLKTFLLIFAFSLLTQHTVAQGWWFRKADYNQSARTAAAVFTIGTGAFLGTGYDSTSFRRNFSVYSQGGNLWTQIQSVGGSTGSGLSRDAAVAFSIGTKGYVGLGQGSNPYLNDLWEYDAGSDTWSQKANFGGSPRRAAAGFAANGKGYVVCGQDAAGFKNDLWMYDPSTNAWSAKATFPGSARRLPVVFVVGSNAYVGTGDDGAFQKDFYKYSTTSNGWSLLPDFAGTPRYGAAAFTIGNDGYVGTGYDNTLTNRKDFWKFNTSTNSWSPVKDFSGTARSNAAGFAIGNFGYVATGYDSLPTRDLWVFDPNSNGIEEMQLFRSSVKVYPNPMTDEANITFDPDLLNDFGNISFTMFDLQGRIVRQCAHVDNASMNIQREQMRSGMYLYCFTGDGATLSTGKIIVR